MKRFVLFALLAGSLGCEKAQAPPEGRFRLYQFSNPKGGTLIVYKIDADTGKAWIHLFLPGGDNPQNRWIPIEQPPEERLGAKVNPFRAPADAQRAGEMLNGTNPPPFISRYAAGAAKEMADTVTTILDAAKATDTQRHDAFDAFHNAKSWEELKAGLDKSGIPNQTKVALWKQWAPVADKLGAKPYQDQPPRQVSGKDTRAAGAKEKAADTKK